MWIAIGAVDLGGWQHFHGLIDEVRIYNRPLAKAEIRELYSTVGAVN
jgi:Concanavalin A-like lectin/glucanases superfamily